MITRLSAVTTNLLVVLLVTGHFLYRDTDSAASSLPEHPSSEIGEGLLAQAPEPADTAADPDQPVR